MRGDQGRIRKLQAIIEHNSLRRICIYQEWTAAKDIRKFSNGNLCIISTVTRLYGWNNQVKTCRTKPFTDILISYTFSRCFLSFGRHSTASHKNPSASSNCSKVKHKVAMKTLLRWLPMQAVTLQH